MGKKMPRLSFVSAYAECMRRTEFFVKRYFGYFVFRDFFEHDLQILQELYTQINGNFQAEQQLYVICGFYFDLQFFFFVGGLLVSVGER